jgi:hypothetical protein
MVHLCWARQICKDVSRRRRPERAVVSGQRRRCQCPKAPRTRGRSEAKSIDGAEHSASLKDVMASQVASGCEPDRALLQALFPVPGSSPVVSDGEDSNLTVDVKVHDVVREARNRTSSHREIGRHPWHGRSGRRQPHDLVMVASTASKNSTPRCCRWSSYHRPAARYSASASSSKRMCGFTAACEVQPRRVAGRLTRGYRRIHRRSHGGLVARFQMPRQLRLQPDYLFRRRPDWPTGPRRRRLVRRSAVSELRVEVPELARSCLMLHPPEMDAREMGLETGADTGQG